MDGQKDNSCLLGLLSKPCMSITSSFFQVSPAKQDNNNDFEDHVICIYTPDYEDKDEILRVDDLIRKAGIRGVLRYKPTIFSVLGIYSNNKWRIPASIHLSKEKK